VVTLNGQDLYLGRWNTSAGRAEYERLTGEWLAAGRRLPNNGEDLTGTQPRFQHCVQTAVSRTPQPPKDIADKPVGHEVGIPTGSAAGEMTIPARKIRPGSETAWQTPG
jgi:hypothetical protein